jgi:hypothetical protein
MKALLSVCAVAACVTGSSAQLTVYTDRATWEAAVGGGVITENFNGQTPGVIADGATLDTGLLQIFRDGSPNGADGLLEIEPGSNFGNLDGTTFLSGETGVTPHERVDISFNGQSVFAFGGDWFSPFSGDGIGLEVGSEYIALDSIAGFDQGFVGFVSNGGAFSTISIVGDPGDITFQELWSVDNVSYAVPSPATAALIVGAMGMVTLRRKR